MTDRAFVAAIAASLLLVAGVAFGAYTWDRHDRAESCVRLGERTGYTTRFTDDSFGVCLIQSSSGGMVPVVGRFTDD
jgi:hypothetical protein